MMYLVIFYLSKMCCKTPCVRAFSGSVLNLMSIKKAPTQNQPRKLKPKQAYRVV